MALVADLDLPPNTPLATAWTMGYLQLASNIGVLPATAFDEAMADMVMAQADAGLAAAAAPIIELPIIATAFQRSEPAHREEIATWLVAALTYVDDDIFDIAATGISLQSFSDWNSISAEHAPAVETLLRHNVMGGQTTSVFGPTGAVTRLQMAQILRNLDSLYFQLHGLERRMGVVADATYEQYTETGMGTMWRHVHVRRADGGVDILQHSMTGGPSPQAGPLDAVVLRGGFVVGLQALEIGDQIEYIVHPATGTVHYVNVGSQVQAQTFRGRLEIINMEEGTMTFRNMDNVMFTFPRSQGGEGMDQDGGPCIRLPANRLINEAALPRGTFYDVTLIGNVITAIAFVGDPVLVPEHRGLVIENNPIFGYITILDADRNELSFTFNPAELHVQRRTFFDARDTIGGQHEMFPSVRGHSRDADISDIIPGDIVVFQVADDDPYRLIVISAAENTTQRYGRVMEFVDQGGYFDMLLEFENGVTQWYTMMDGILVRDQGRPVSPNRIQVGDWVTIIINQAMLAPGVLMESVREVNIDGGGHHITSVVTGQLSGFSSAQNQLQLQHARELTPAGWSNHRPLASFNIGGPNVRYYYNGRRVTLAHLNRYLQRSDATVYMALENHFAGERAVMVSVRSGRDELFRTGHVLSAANNSFQMLEIPGNIQTDAGTIVVRNGRLVEQHQIFSPDWARVALNGPSAAVVDISQPPATDGVQIVRARIAQVWPFDSFRVETMSIFDGFRWNFTPIAREFTIDHNTIFINEGGFASIDDFLGFTEASVIGDVFNVIVEGGRAVRVIDAPFTEPIPAMPNAPGHLTVRGIIYAIDGDTVSLRDMTVYHAQTGAWSRFSLTNPTGTVTTFENSIIIDRNEVIGANRLQVGQQIMAFSNVRRDEVDLAPGLAVDAFIVLVEN
jgi:hypothetical protein